MKLMLGGSDSMIVRASHDSETARGTVSFCHGCAILSGDFWAVLMLFSDFPSFLPGMYKVL